MGPKEPSHRSRGQVPGMHDKDHQSGRGKENSDHASARAGVRIAATPARAALVPCDILNFLPPGGDPTSRIND